MPRPLSRTITAVILTAALLGVVACSDESGGGVNTGESEGLSVGPVDLSNVCPANVIIQTDWHPQAEQGGLFNLLGEDATIDAAAKQVAGPMYYQDTWTGVNVEIRAGGPAIGYTGVPAQMYTDPDILLGWVNTDEAIANSATQPTTAVMATFEKAPWMIMWDPETYPEATTIADLSGTDTTVRYFDGATFMDYLIDSGQLRSEQVDGSYDGAPASFVAAGGRDAQQGFATVEPWVYENAVDDWAKPVRYQLIADTGYPIYAVALSVRSAAITEQADCLRALIPVIQQSTVDYFSNPDAANGLIAETVLSYDSGWIYPIEQAVNSTEQQRELGLVADSPDGTFGAFDLRRVQKVIDLVEPIMAAQNVTIKDDITPEVLVTNEFLDPSIDLP